MITRYGVGTGPLAIAHRGGAGLAPENTLNAFGRSYDLGFRYLETDVRLSADGVPVIFHDATLRRVTGRGGTVRGRTAAALAGHRVLGGDVIPTLAEALATFPRACFTVDLKDRAAIGPVAQVITAADAAARVCLAGSWDSWLQAVRAEVGPDLRVALGWRTLIATLARLRTGRLRRTPFGPHAFAHVPLRLGRVAIVHDDLAERAHDIGVRVVVWTVDDADTMHRLLDAGVDGIITDRPDVLREVMIARDQWPVPPALEAVAEAG